MKMKGNRVKNLDTGNMLRWEMKQQNLNYSVIARKMSRNRATVKRLMNNTSVQTYILWEFCKAMNHIFFADFAGWLPPDMHASKGNPATRRSELEKENAELRAQLKTLQNVVDLLAGK